MLEHKDGVCFSTFSLSAEEVQMKQQKIEYRSKWVSHIHIYVNTEFHKRNIDLDIDRSIKLTQAHEAPAKKFKTTLIQTTTTDSRSTSTGLRAFQIPDCKTQTPGNYKTRTCR